ncbi:MAG: bifunctional UDP-N-acetylglucosamine diphosphorylase/glucosamine-1-phosphate N-acetyltransferase GlmU [Leptospirales bacterium]
MIFDAAILAAGFGTRMRSPTPKMATPILGEPLLRYPYDAVCRVSPPAQSIFVVAGRDPIESLLPEGVLWVHQHAMDGTLGALEAVLLSRTYQEGASTHLLVLNGDAPLVDEKILGGFMEAVRKEPDAFWFVSTELADPGRYGRVIRDSQFRVTAVREWVDLDDEGRAIPEVNAGIYSIPRGFLERSVGRVLPHPEKNERFLTSLFALASEESLPIQAYHAGPESVLGVNTQGELSLAARILKERINHYWMEQGVTFWDPLTTFIGPGVVIGSGTVLYPGVIIEGETSLAESCRIGAGSHLRNVRLGAGVHIRDYCVLSDSIVEEGAVVGPFAHLRPGSHLEQGSHVGNFVETKKVRLGQGAKANHLAYLGDATVGERTNIGAGTITCNYNGASKYETHIGKDVFIGSDTQIVAPVVIGDGAVIAAGTTVTRDIPPGSLAISRTVQVNREDRGTHYRARILEKMTKKEDS